MYYLIALLLAALIYYQARVSGRVLATTVYEPEQKRLQLALIWLLPLFGAILAHQMLISSDLPDPPVPAAAEDELEADALDIFDMLDR